MVRGMQREGLQLTLELPPTRLLTVQRDSTVAFILSYVFLKMGSFSDNPPLGSYLGVPPMYSFEIEPLLSLLKTLIKLCIFPLTL